MSKAVVSWEELAKHATQADCWVAIHGTVYDLTAFLKEHPGGAKVILREAGKDGTKAFDQIHPKDIISRMLSDDRRIGALTTAPAPVETSKKAEAATTSTVVQAYKKPPLAAILNLFDFEAVAEKVLTPQAWAYYSSAADDELTLAENRAAFQRILLRPRVMLNVGTVSTSTTLFGYPSALPFYITATALGKLGHPEGEAVLTRAAGTRGIIQMIPTLASCSLEELTDARVKPDQIQFFQLYVNPDRKRTEELVRTAEKRGCKALFITVDAPQLGRRERDMRMKFVDDLPDVQQDQSTVLDQGAARAISTFIDPTLSWSDLPWFRSITSLPIVLKGVQCAEDAVLAYKFGCSGVVLSNHGGRQLDTARSGIEILPEVMDALHAEKIDTNKFEVYVDGGVRRGTDIFKAIAMGAKAVGIGRPFLYAMSGYGQQGVERAIDLLRDELEMTMRLMGTTRIQDAVPRMVVADGLTSHIAATPRL
ncbi:FMN-dependent dehydrogenase-domain-containing protein [Cladochytrium replicatum]|nr:FMN-dependent dehydrogenase-domain-containing protein [Cladochytrium replicatum]